jgi:NAD(P)-dependent dehydrogenase (short-subunit alcohol dehydrogenase family)
MDLRLNGLTAVVTGASRGIGLAVTRGFVAEGVRVTAGALTSSAELDELAGTGRVRVVEVDLAAPDGPARLVAAAGDRIDILVNNVGAAPARPGGFAGITDEDWQATLNLDLMAAVRATRAALPVMLAAGKGAEPGFQGRARASHTSYVSASRLVLTITARARGIATSRAHSRRSGRYFTVSLDFLAGS